jgi:hypothetical protein
MLGCGSGPAKERFPAITEAECMNAMQLHMYQRLNKEAFPAYAFSA